MIARRPDGPRAKLLEKHLSVDRRRRVVPALCLPDGNWMLPDPAAVGIIDRNNLKRVCLGVPGEQHAGCRICHQVVETTRRGEAPLNVVGFCG